MKRRKRGENHEYKIFNGPELKFTWTPENLIYIRYEDPSTWRYNEYFFDDEVPAKFYLKGGKNGCAPDENHEVYKYAYFDPSAYDEDNQCYKYDSVPPMAKMNFTNYENITFTVEDFLGKGSGVKSARIEIQNKVYQINTEPYTLTLPLHGIADYMTLPTTDKFKYTASDKAGNTITSEIWNRFVESDIDHISTLNNSQISIHYNSSNINRHADVYTLSEENVWTLIKSADWKKDSYYYFTFNDNSVTNKWVKLSAYNKDEYDSSTIPLSSPYFIYMGNESSPLYDSMIKNGNTTSSVTVTSDSPVYVHTLCTRNSNCSAWNARQWCLLGKEVDSAVLNFSSTDTRNKSYTINSYNFEHNIPAGAYYVIISHFARNDPNEQYTFMTEPVKK
ncbi:MAG: hypothetical protein J5780_07190 [Treponema sp.]|nr:hypothetical protein [Treponema sp.]